MMYMSFTFMRYSFAMHFTKRSRRTNLCKPVQSMSSSWGIMKLTPLRKPIKQFIVTSWTRDPPETLQTYRKYFVDCFCIVPYNDRKQISKLISSCVTQMHTKYNTNATYNILHTTCICDCLSENLPSSHLPVFREIPF